VPALVSSLRTREDLGIPAEMLGHRRSPIEIATLRGLGAAPPRVQVFPSCGHIRAYRGSFCWDYGTGAARVWCKTTRSGRRYVERSPAFEGGAIHAAHDIFGERGSAIYAVEDGVIRRRNLRPHGDGGYMVTLDAHSGRTYIHSHLNEPGLIGEGEEVLAGTRIGLMGDTGNAHGKGVHLHLQALEFLWGIGEVPVDVYDELLESLVDVPEEIVALNGLAGKPAIWTEEGAEVPCHIPPERDGGGGSRLLIAAGLAVAAAGAYFTLRSRR